MTTRRSTMFYLMTAIGIFYASTTLSDPSIQQQERLKQMKARLETLQKTMNSNPGSHEQIEAAKKMLEKYSGHNDDIAQAVNDLDTDNTCITKHLGLEAGQKLNNKLMKPEVLQSFKEISTTAKSLCHKGRNVASEYNEEKSNSLLRQVLTSREYQILKICEDEEGAPTHVHPCDV